MKDIRRGLQNKGNHHGTHFRPACFPGKDRQKMFSRPESWVPVVERIILPFARTGCEELAVDVSWVPRAKTG
jgi:hypothetical protein